MGMHLCYYCATTMRKPSARWIASIGTTQLVGGSLIPTLAPGIAGILPDAVILGALLLRASTWSRIFSANEAAADRIAITTGERSRSPYPL